MRKAEVVAAGTEHETYLPARQVALDDDIYYIVKQTQRAPWTRPALRRPLKAVRSRRLRN